MDFTDELKDDIRTVAREVIDAYNNRTNALSDERLVSLNKNYFGFYCKYANEVYNSLVDLSSYSDIIGTKEYDKLMSDLSICKSILDACSDHVKRMQVQNAREIMLNNGIQVHLLYIITQLRILRRLITISLLLHDGLVQAIRLMMKLSRHYSIYFKILKILLIIILL